MKKRAMKKWIPNDIAYCCNCKWLRFNKNKDYFSNGYCKYLGLGDWYKNNRTILLWDACKNCDVHIKNN